MKGIISSKTKEEGEKPLLLLHGNFSITQEVALTDAQGQPEISKGQSVLDTVGFSVKEQEMVTQARYLIPEGTKGENLSVCVRSPEILWHETECSVDGSYLVFSLKNGENQIAVIESKTAPSLWYGVAAIILLVFIIAVISERKHKAKLN